MEFGYKILKMVKL